MEDHHPIPPKDPVHEPWDFCTRCFCEEWDNSEKPTRSRTIVNIYPFATELRSWLMQKPTNIRIILPTDLYIENPFTYHASCLVVIFTEVVIDYTKFLKRRDDIQIEPWQIDLKRMRMVSEIILYAVRICEVLFKQLLYCTKFDFKRYWKKSLGSLLVQSCSACKGKNKHTVSLVGSLAHRYKLCGQYEQCLKKDLNYLNRLRNTQAAHATVDQNLISSTIDEALIVAEQYLNDIGRKFLHMLEHISEIEQAMIQEAGKRLLTENRIGKYNSNLVSTYYWEIAFRRLYILLLTRKRQE